jgi:hypothetical protein
MPPRNQVTVRIVVPRVCARPGCGPGRNATMTVLEDRIEMADSDDVRLGQAL